MVDDVPGWGENENRADRVGPGRPMRRFLLFAYDEFSPMHPEDGGPKGGMEDFHGDFDEIADARRHLDTLSGGAHMPRRFDHAEVLDTTTGARISFDESPPCAVHRMPGPPTAAEVLDFRPLLPEEVRAAMTLPPELVGAIQRGLDRFAANTPPPGTVNITPAGAQRLLGRAVPDLGSARSAVNLCSARSESGCLLLHGGHGCRYNAKADHDLHICQCDTTWGGPER